MVIQIFSSNALLSSCNLSHASTNSNFSSSIAFSFLALACPLSHTFLLFLSFRDLTSFSSNEDEEKDVISEDVVEF
jgi:hypothetical protein